MQFRFLSCAVPLLYGLLLQLSPGARGQELPGSLDTSFFTDGGADATVRAVTIQPDGKVLIGGIFNKYYGVTNRGIARINVNGSADTTFTSPITDQSSTVSAIAVQTNGQIVVGLDATVPLLRLHTNGAIDVAFSNAGTGPDGAVHTIAVQPDGKILIGGDFTRVHGQSRGRIARLNSDGTLDGTFIPGAGANYTVEAIQLLPDGKVYIAGQFQTYRNVPRSGICRLMSDGNLDSTFTPGQGANAGVFSMAIQSDGKPIIGGFFSAYDNHPQNAVARLNTNGTYDATFQSIELLVDGHVNAMQLQRDGKVVVAGDMTQAHLVRLNLDGTQDETYQPGLGPSDDVYAMAIQRDQRILIGGLFVAVDLTAANFVARLNGDLKLLSPLKANATFSAQIQTVSGHTYRLEKRTSVNESTWTEIPGTDVTGDGTVKTIRDTSASVPGRFYRVHGFAD